MRSSAAGLCPPKIAPLKRGAHIRRYGKPKVAPTGCANRANAVASKPRFSSSAFVHLSIVAFPVPTYPCTQITWFSSVIISLGGASCPPVTGPLENSFSTSFKRIEIFSGTDHVTSA